MANELTRLALDERESAFVGLVAAGRDPVDAARAAGYGDSTARNIRASVMRRPDVLAALHLEVARAIANDAPIARKVIMEIIQDKTASAKVRGDLAVKVLGLTGHIAPRAKAAGDANEKPLNEMTVEELKTIRDRLEDELAGRAKPVNAPSAPTPRVIDVELLD